METRYTELTGIAPQDATDIHIRMQVLAGELAALSQQLQETRAQLLPTTSSEKYLDAHAQMCGFTRHTAVHSSGTLRFVRQYAALVDIPIPAGTTASGGGIDPVCVATTEPALLPSGSLFIDVPARATLAGPGGNLPRSYITTLVSPVMGIAQVENPLPFRGGTEEEDDSTLRRRILHSSRYHSNGSNAAYYYRIAAAVPEIEQVRVLPRRRGKGTVDIVVTTSEPSVLKQLQQTYQKEREIAVDTRVLHATLRPQPLHIQLQAAPGYRFADIAPHCHGTATRFLEQLGIGMPLLCNHLGKLLLEVEGVQNYRFIVPTQDIYPLADEKITGTEPVITEWGK